MPKEPANPFTETKKAAVLSNIAMMAMMADEIVNSCLTAQREAEGDNVNAAVGILIGADRTLEAIKALYAATMATHRHGA